MNKLDLSKKLEEIAADLVSIPSESGCETEIVDSIADVLEKQCIDEDLHINRHKNNIVVRYHYNNSADKMIGLVGHVDTVPASRENHTTPEIRDGKLYGLGSVDMKSSDAMMLKLCYELAQGTFRPNHELAFVFYDGEENPLPNGITELLEETSLIKDIDFAYVLEPTQERYEIGCLGSITAKVSVKGTSAHSASPWLGENSIYHAVDVINRIKETKDNPVTIDGFDATETINVTKIETPNAHNMIPGVTNLFVNYRFSPDRSMDSAQKEFEQACGKDVTITYLDKSPSAYAPVNGFHTMKEGVPTGIIRGWTDIAQLIKAGIPAVNFGPGSISVAHKQEEHIDIAELRAFYDKLKTHL